MSEEVKSEVVTGILANPNDKVPPEKVVVLLEEWRNKVISDIADYNDKKDEIYKVYKRQKEMYDKWLSGPMGKMKKLDKIISGRKKVLMDVDKEISKIKESLAQPTNAQ